MVLQVVAERLIFCLVMTLGSLVFTVSNAVLRKLYVVAIKVDRYDGTFLSRGFIWYRYIR